MSISYFNNAHPDPDVANREQSSFHIADGIGEHKKASRGGGDSVTPVNVHI